MQLIFLQLREMLALNEADSPYWTDFYNEECEGKPSSRVRELKVSSQ